MTTTYRTQADGIPVIDKSPNEVLDYPVDWSAAAPIGPWLESGETIVSSTVVADAGLTVASSTATSTVVTAWLSGGTVGVVYIVTVKIVTSANRTGERSFRVNVIHR